MLIIFIASLTLINLVNCQTNRTSKVFNVFQVTKFPNDECTVSGTKVASNIFDSLPMFPYLARVSVSVDRSVTLAEELSLVLVLRVLDRVVQSM